MVLGTVKLQIPFSSLKLVIDVHLLELMERVPTLLPLRDMIINGLDLK